jgi:peptide-methionine (R)-S-oxide reductase
MNDVDDSRLTDQQKKTLRDGATEAPGTGALLNNKDDGMYRCAACDAKLFESDTKFDSGSGWPSFDRAIDGAIKYKEDNSMFMKRTKAVCANCGGHLGHVFNDGPKETTGKRYCINSCSLDFEGTDGNRRSGAKNQT